MHNLRSKDKYLKLSDIVEGLKLALRFNHYILRYWKLELAIFILGGSAILLGLLTPYLGKIILDKGVMTKDINALIFWSILAAVGYLVSLTFSLFYDYLKNYTLIKMRIDLSRDILKKIKLESFSQLQDSPSAINLFNLVTDINSSATVINVTLIQFLNSLLKIMLITAILLFLNPWLLLIICIYQLFTMFKIHFLVKPMEIVEKLSLKTSEEIYVKLNSIFSHIYLLKVFGTLGREIKEYMRIFLDAARTFMISARLRGLENLFSNILKKIFLGISTFLGAVLVIQGKITLGTLGVSLIYLILGNEAFSSLLDMAGQLVINRVSLKRAANLLDQNVPAHDSNQSGVFTAEIKRIEFKDVTFGYQPNKKILQGMNFVIEASSRVGLVGYSGCGKSTIINLILGLYHPANGSILIGNRDLQELDTAHLLNNIAVAMQEPLLFSATIADNISYALKNATRTEILEAASVAGALDFINASPLGFDTVIGEGGYKLSQGQKQRIAIARALIKNPQVIILDEAMSSLDPVSESKIIGAIGERFKGATLILISHRLEAIERMDVVYFLKSAEKMNIGKHKDLLNGLAEYGEFFKNQPHIAQAF